jgi:hypothetical protein
VVRGRLSHSGAVDAQFLAIFWGQERYRSSGVISHCCTLKKNTGEVFFFTLSIGKDSES